MLFAKGDDLSYGLNTLGPLCLWQCYCMRTRGTLHTASTFLGGCFFSTFQFYTFSPKAKKVANFVKVRECVHCVLCLQWWLVFACDHQVPGRQIASLDPDSFPPDPPCYKVEQALFTLVHTSVCFNALAFAAQCLCTAGCESNKVESAPRTKGENSEELHHRVGGDSVARIVRESCILLSSKGVASMVVFHLPFSHLPPHILYHLPPIFLCLLPPHICICEGKLHIAFVQGGQSFNVSPKTCPVQWNIMAFSKKGCSDADELWTFEQPARRHWDKTLSWWLSQPLHCTMGLSIALGIWNIWKCKGQVFAQFWLNTH